MVTEESDIVFQQAGNSNWSCEEVVAPVLDSRGTRLRVPLMHVSIRDQVLHKFVDG